MSSVEDLENIWERLAEAIDRAGAEREVLFLSKLALLLANDLRNPARVNELIETALRNLT